MAIKKIETGIRIQKEQYGWVIISWFDRRDIWSIYLAKESNRLGMIHYINDNRE